MDADGLAFVSYLHPLLEEDEKRVPHFLRRHKEQIERGLTDYSERPRVLPKYRWAARYHNFFCKRFVPDAAPDLRVAHHSFAPGFALLVGKPTLGPEAA